MHAEAALAVAERMRRHSIGQASVRLLPASPVPPSQAFWHCRQLHCRGWRQRPCTYIHISPNPHPSVSAQVDAAGL